MDNSEEWLRDEESQAIMARYGIKGYSTGSAEDSREKS